MKYRKYWDYHRINAEGTEEKQLDDEGSIFLDNCISSCYDFIYENIN